MMRILLLGEYSGFNLNLKKGLISLGHDVVLVSSGDGFKNIIGDINLVAKSGLLGKIIYRRDFLSLLKEIKGYDVVQLINPFFIPDSFFPVGFFLKTLKKNNNKIFLSAAGDDSFFWTKGRETLKYGPFEDVLKYDLKMGSHPYAANEAIKFNNFVANMVDGIIPVMYEYEASYQGHKNLCSTIALPIDCSTIEYKKNIVDKKIKIFHGLNRYGFKGTRFIESAFDVLKKKYPNDLELIIAGNIPLDKYISVIEKANVIVDQTYSYSCGMNCLYSMALGKIIIGGNEPESLRSIGVKSSPVINIKPSVEDIINKVEFVLENRAEIGVMGYESRKFVENVHGHAIIAQKYIDLWCS